MRAGATLRANAVNVHRRAGYLRKEGQAIVEFVIADGAAVVADRIHRLIDGQFLAAIDLLHLGLVVG